jgi:hypothetical protein
MRSIEPVVSGSAVAGAARPGQDLASFLDPDNDWQRWFQASQKWPISATRCSTLVKSPGATPGE